jgi:hypothetical protein
MNNETLHLLGVNHHQTGVDLYIGTEDELRDIATAGNNEIFEVSPEEKVDPDSPWPEGPGWYYAIGDREYTKVDTCFEGIAEILQHDGHPLSFTVDRAKEIIELADAGKPTGLWHHNEFKVVSAIRRCLEEKLILDPLDPEYITATDCNGHKTNFHVGDRVLVHEDEGSLWEGEVLGFADGSLHLESDKDEGFESPSICEIINK